MKTLVGVILVLGMVVPTGAETDAKSTPSRDATRCCNEESSPFQLLIGPGFTWLQDDYVDFKEVREADTHIFIDNDSKSRSQLMLGAAIKVREWNLLRLDLVLAVDNHRGGQPLLDGGFLGAGVQFKEVKYIEFVVGVSRKLGKELSHGFQRHMSEYITNKGGIINGVKDYDGLPLYKSESKERIFPGNPLANSFNTKFSIGILISIDLWKQIKEAAKPPKNTK